MLLSELTGPSTEWTTSTMAGATLCIASASAPPPQAQALGVQRATSELTHVALLLFVLV